LSVIRKARQEWQNVESNQCIPPNPESVFPYSHVVVFVLRDMSFIDAACALCIASEEVALMTIRRQYGRTTGTYVWFGVHVLRVLRVFNQ
jgi:hypothetical protein